MHEGEKQMSEKWRPLQESEGCGCSAEGETAITQFGGLLKPLTPFSTSNFKDQWPGSDSNTNETQIIKLLGNEDRSLIELFMSLIILLRGASLATGHAGSGKRIFRCDINHLIFRQLCVTGNTKVPELHLTARHCCPELIETFLGPYSDSQGMPE